MVFALVVLFLGGLALAPLGCSTGAATDTSDAQAPDGTSGCVTDHDCPTGQRCNSGGACVGCLTSSDCAAGQRCVAGGCADGCDGTSTCPIGKVCDLATQACVSCTKDSDCSTSKPKCSPTTMTCVACLGNADCPAGSICQANVCAQGCDASGGCPSGQVCNTTSGTCVQCVQDTDCKVPTPRCDPAKDTCVECLPAMDNCPMAQYCALTTCQAGCKTSSDCVGSPSGMLCNTTTHACAECMSDQDCALGRVCASGQCAVGCDATHGCPAGQGCCTGACTPTNTVQNCGTCGTTCDTTHSLGAACNGSSCTYTGCASGYGDCNLAAPDSNGCETNLGAANEKLCGAACVPVSSCCANGDCTSPPAPATCYGKGTCSGPGGTCSYAQNLGSVVCNASTCCNDVNGTCNANCTLNCSGGFAHCSGDPSQGCETNVGTNTADCGSCGRSCSGANVLGLSCNGGACNSTCQPGWGNCSQPAAPSADDGCESNLTTCAGTACCTSGACVAQHSDGLGQTYSDCVPFGVPGNAATYTATMTNEASTAWSSTATLDPGATCLENPANPSGPADLCAARYTNSACAVWCYTGILAGRVFLQNVSGTNESNCGCPLTTDAAWN